MDRNYTDIVKKCKTLFENLQFQVFLTSQSIANGIYVNINKVLLNLYKETEKKEECVHDMKSKYDEEIVRLQQELTTTKNKLSADPFGLGTKIVNFINDTLGMEESDEYPGLSFATKLWFLDCEDSPFSENHPFPGVNEHVHNRKICDLFDKFHQHKFLVHFHKSHMDLYIVSKSDYENHTFVNNCSDYRKIHYMYHVQADSDPDFTSDAIYKLLLKSWEFDLNILPERWETSNN
jgi:hypothetical protein